MKGKEFVSRLHEVIITLSTMPPPVGLIETVRTSKGAAIIEDRLPVALKWLQDFSEQWNQAWEERGDGPAV